MFYGDLSDRASVLPWRLQRTVALPLGIGLSQAALSLAAGWPYWAAHPLSAILATLMAMLLAGAGAVLALGSGSPRTGYCLIAAAFFFSLAWLGAWDAGLGPVIGEYSQSLFFLILGSGILLDGRAAYDHWSEWAWVLHSFLVLVVQQTAIIVILTPQQMGYSANVFWPSVTVLSNQAASRFLTFTGVMFILLALSFISVMIRLRRRVTARHNQGGLLLLVIGGLLALGSAIIQYPVMAAGTSLDAVMSARVSQGVFAILVPLALFGWLLRQRWNESVVASRLAEILGSVTPESVEVALQVVLSDPELKLWIWLPSTSSYVDVDGRLRSVSDFGEPAYGVNSQQEIRTRDGERLARCDFGNGIALVQQSLVSAAFAACMPSLRAIQLQVENLEYLRAGQGRLLEAERQGRSELARNLHDGVQQDLAALHIELGRIARRSADPDALAMVTDCQQHVTQITEELRRITRGLHPPVLSEGGLAAALEADAERLGRAIQLQVLDERLPPRVEVTMYYALTEALTNVDKHARAKNVVIAVRSTGGKAVGEVIDDGIGGAAMTLGGGLYGIEDRVRAFRGSLTVTSSPSGGTRVTVTLPMSEALT